MIFEAVAAFNSMAKELKVLGTMIEEYECDVHLPSCNPPVHDNLSPSVRDMLLNLWHESDGDGRSTLVFQGLVVAPSPVLQQVKTVNAAKAEFHQLMRAISDSKTDSVHDARHAIAQSTGFDRELLKYTGLARLNLNHCYRTIPYHDHPVIKVRFSWSRGELSIIKLTPEEAVQQLMNLNRSLPTHIAIQIEKASALPPSARLAKVQVNTHRLKANLVMDTVSPDGERTTTRKTIRTSLPLFVPKGSVTPLVRFRERPEDKPKRLDGLNRQNRNDRQIDETPFLPSIRAHLYKPKGHK